MTTSSNTKTALHLAQEDVKTSFHIIPEKQYWHLESKSGTYDEIADLWHSLRKNQEIVERLKKELEGLEGHEHLDPNCRDCQFYYKLHDEILGNTKGNGCKE